MTIAMIANMTVAASRASGHEGLLRQDLAVHNGILYCMRADATGGHAALEESERRYMSEPAREVVDLSRLLDEGPWSALQKRVLALAALAFAVDGIANQALGLALPALIRDWAVPREAFAPVAALGLIGVALGSAIGGLLGDRTGRRAGLIGSVVLFGAMTAAMAAVHGFPALLALRFLAGLGIGGAIPNGAALLSEFTPFRHRNIAIAVGMLLIPVGGVIAGTIGALVLASWGWRGVFAICGLLPLLVGLAFVFALPESPRFLARLPHRHVDLRALLARCGLVVTAGSLLHEEPATHRAPWHALLERGRRLDSIALWFGFFFCLLASYTMFSWVPTMLMGQGFGLAMTSVGLTSFNIGGMLGGVACGWLIGLLGSRTAGVGLALGATAGALVLGVLPFDPQSAVRVCAALLAEGMFIGGLHNALYTVAAFIYPPAVRATGVGAAAGLGRIGAVVSSYTGVLTLKLAGPSGYFIVIAVALALAGLGTAGIRRGVPPRTQPGLAVHT